ncbi:MAG TPA: amidase [Puia sp.]|nr:amidase [Puia sp.]
MDRRKFLRNGAAAGLGLSSLHLDIGPARAARKHARTAAGAIGSATQGIDPAAEYIGPVKAVTKDVTAASADQFPLLEASIDTLQQKMQSGEYTSQSITRLYLERIAGIDKKGPALNAVIELNPDALAIAEQMDAERKAGKVRGPLHGIPVLIKDNINTGDKMQTTAGSLAMEGHIAAKDAFIIGKLRESGAVLLGKTNLSEWANFRSTRSTSGWSSRGGQTRNPYLLNRDPSGSSAGSGSAVSASLCAVAIGTETNGSVVSPSSVNGIVGIKPTVGLLSRSGIIPISVTQDTAGPMARTVKDAALLLTTLAGIDAEDAVTLESQNKAGIDYASALDTAGLKGKTIGIEKAALTGGHEGVVLLFQEAITVLKAQGATIVEIELQKLLSDPGSVEGTVLQYEFKDGLNRYLATAGAPMKTLADIIAFNKQNEKRAMPYFKQETLEHSEALGSLDTPQYTEALKKLLTARTIIDNLLRQNGLDAIAAPTSGPACLIDLISGDYRTGSSFSAPAAMAGYPHITVPMGLVLGMPVGLSLMGTSYTEAQLIRMAYAYEQASQKRSVPKMVEGGNF